MIGKIIGNYQITGELARGGMGAVYRGRHQKLPREVVVKVILLSSFPPHLQEQLKARFLREAYIQSQLDHPNIVRVHEFFTAEENYYLVMEYVEGMNLSDLVRTRGAVSMSHAIPLFKQALSALDYAHNFKYVDESGRQKSGIVHRDIKPANILLDGMGRLKITDFGIVKVAGEKGMTRTGFNPGTAEYMSPEQIRGMQVDARSDLYSLGVTFYQALSGRLPFPASESGSEYEVLRGHIELPPPPLAAVQPNLSEAISAIVMHSLEKEPSARFQSASEFLDALLAYQNTPDGAVKEKEQLVVHLPQQITHSMTDPLINQGSERDAPVSDHSHSTNPLVMAGRGKRRSALPVLLLVALFLCSILGSVAFFIWRHYQNAGGDLITIPVPTPTVTVTPVSVPEEDARLKKAREHEQEELYLDSIRLYEDYLREHREGSGTISEKVAKLKQLQGLLSMAELEIKRRDFSAARNDFYAALKIRPDSKRAQNGLKEVDARLAGSGNAPAK